MARYGLKMAVYQLPIFFGIRRTCTETKVTSETITLDPIKVLTCSTPQNDCKNLSFVKDRHTHGEKMARKGHAKVIYKFSFVSNRSISYRKKK